MKAKLIKEGLVLIAETKAEDEELLKEIYKKGLKIYGKACFKNKRGRHEALMQHRHLYKPTKAKSLYER